MGLSEEECHWYAGGMTAEQARAHHQAIVLQKAREKPETDAQRCKRAEREERKQARYREQWWRQARKERLRRNDLDYRAGRARGGDIGLDQQVKQQRKEILT
jgi:hypothetical protein